MNNYQCYIKQGKAFFQKGKIPSKRFVLKKMGVRCHSYAGKMISRLYDYYFDGAVAFADEYKKYYSKEFDSVTDFIEDHYNLDHESAIKYAEGNFSMKECAFYSIDRSIESLNYYEEFRRLFSNAVGGILDEDPDWIYY